MALVGDFLSGALLRGEKITKIDYYTTRTRRTSDILVGSYFLCTSMSGDREGSMSERGILPT